MSDPTSERDQILEFCGWKSVMQEERGFSGKPKMIHYWQMPNGNLVRPTQRPDVFEDLNAMRDAEACLNSTQLIWMEKILANIVFKDTTDDDWADDKGPTANCKIWHASASQRARAFLKVISQTP